MTTILSTTGAAFSAWYDLVLPYVPGCPTVLADLHLRQAAIRFCTEGKALVRDLAEVAAQDANPTYTPTLAAGEDLVQVLAVWWDGKRLTFQSLDELDDRYGESRWEDKDGTPAYWTALDGDTFRVVPYPALGGTSKVRARVLTCPTQTATTLPDALFSDYQKDIADGALASLMMMPRKEWSDPQTGAVKEGNFQAAIDEASLRFFRSYGRGVPQRRARFY